MDARVDLYVELLTWTLKQPLSPDSRAKIEKHLSRLHAIQRVRAVQRMQTLSNPPHAYLKNRGNANLYW